MQATARLDAIFAALADPTRRAIVARLASGQASVNELARPVDAGVQDRPARGRQLSLRMAEGRRRLHHGHGRRLPRGPGAGADRQYREVRRAVVWRRSRGHARPHGAGRQDLPHHDGLVRVEGDARCRPQVRDDERRGAELRPARRPVDVPAEVTMQKITPFLWFNDNAEEAMNFYVSIFKNSKVGRVTRYGDAGPGPKGSVMWCTFTLEGQEFHALNGGPQFKFTPAISLFVNCETQQEVDELWRKLSAGGREDQCGWLQAKYVLA